MIQKKKNRLGQLKRSQKGLILHVGRDWVPVENSEEPEFQTHCDSELVNRLMEMGFIEGKQVEILHEAPFTGDPIVVFVSGSLIALRRCEANLIEVMPETTATTTITPEEMPQLGTDVVTVIVPHE